MVYKPHITLTPSMETRTFANVPIDENDVCEEFLIKFDELKNQNHSIESNFTERLYLILLNKFSTQFREIKNIIIKKEDFGYKVSIWHGEWVKKSDPEKPLADPDWESFDGVDFNDRSKL